MRVRQYTALSIDSETNAHLDDIARKQRLATGENVSKASIIRRIVREYVERVSGEV